MRSRTPSCGSSAPRRSASASPPTSSTSTTSTTSCATEGWRFNGQQYPNAIHMAVTRPQTQPGVVERVRRRPRRGRRLRQGEARRRRGGLHRRDLRRRGRRADRRGRGVHRRGHDRHARHPAVACRRRSRVSRAADGDGFVLAVDLGHRRPEGRPGLARRRDRLVGAPRRRARRTAPGGAATQDAERVVAARRRRDPARARRAGRSPATRWSPSGVTGQWASTVPVDADGHPGRALRHVDGHPRARAHSGAVVGGPRAGLRRRAALATWVRRSGGVPSTVRRRPGRAHAAPRARPARRRRARPGGTSSRSTT